MQRIAAVAPSTGWRRRTIIRLIGLIIVLDLVLFAVCTALGGFMLRSAQHGLRASSVSGAGTAGLADRVSSTHTKLIVAEASLGIARVLWLPWQPLTNAIAGAVHPLRVVGTIGPLLDLGVDGSHAGATVIGGVMPVLDAARNGRKGTGDMGPAIVQGLRAGHDTLQAAIGDFGATERDLARVDRSALPPVLRSPLNSVAGLLPAAREGLQAALVAPQMLGGAGQRTYLLVPQNPLDLRASGGFIGTVALLQVDNGHIKLTDYQSSDTVDSQRLAYIPPPLPLQAYQHFSNWMYRDGNWSPNFPTTAALLRYFYWLGKGHEPDGVIAFDTYLLGPLLRITGPVTVPRTGVTLTEQNALSALDYNVNGAGAINKGFAGAAYSAVFDQLRAMPLSSIPVAVAAIRDALAQRHLLVWTSDASVESLLLRDGWDGAVDQTRSDYLYVVDTNVHYNKVNHLVRERIAYRARLASNRSLVSTVSLSYYNGATPANLPPPQNNTLYEDFVRVYVPLGSQLLGTRGLSQPWRVEQADNKTVLSGYLKVPSLQSRTISFTYRVPPNALLDPTTYHLTVQKQPGTDAVPLSVDVRAESPYVRIGTGSGWSWSGYRHTDLHFAVPLHGGQPHPTPLAYDASPAVSVVPNVQIEPWVILPGGQSPDDCGRCRVTPAPQPLTSATYNKGQGVARTVQFRDVRGTGGPDYAIVRPLGYRAIHMSLPASAPRVLRLTLYNKVGHELDVVVNGQPLAQVRPQAVTPSWAPVEIPLPSGVGASFDVEVRNPGALPAYMSSVTVRYVPRALAFRDVRPANAPSYMQLPSGARRDVRLALSNATPRVLHLAYSAVTGRDVDVIVDGTILTTLGSTGGQWTSQDVLLPGSSAAMVQVSLRNRAARPVSIGELALQAVPSSYVFHDNPGSSNTPSYAPLAPGERYPVRLALPNTNARVLDIVHQDLTGHDVDVYADGRFVAHVAAGASGGQWATHEVLLPPGLGSTFMLELRNPTGQIDAIHAVSLHYLPTVVPLNSGPGTDSMPLNPGERFRLRLALPNTAPRMLHVTYQDLLGHDFDVLLDGKPLQHVTAGTTGQWVTANILLPPHAGTILPIQLYNAGTAIAAVRAVSVDYLPSSWGAMTLNPGERLPARLALPTTMPRELRVVYQDLAGHDFDVLVNGKLLAHIAPTSPVGQSSTAELPLPRDVGATFEVELRNPTTTQTDSISAISVVHLPSEVAFHETGGNPPYTVLNAASELPVRLALPTTRPRELRIVYQDLAGRDFDVLVNGAPLQHVHAGASGGQWVTREVLLPSETPADFVLTLNNPGKQPIAISRVSVAYVPQDLVLQDIPGSSTTPSYAQIGPSPYIVHLALPTTAPRALRLVYFDAPGRDFDVLVDGALVQHITAGTTQGLWRPAQVRLPASTGPTFTVGLRTRGAEAAAVHEVSVQQANR